MPVLMWGGRVAQIAEFAYPHPQGWSAWGLTGCTLDRADVRALTGAFRDRQDRTPPCEAAWAAYFHGDLPWRDIWSRLSSPLLTPRDFKSYTRILHRSMRLRAYAPVHDSQCRCCRRAEERFRHLGRCPVLRKVWVEWSATIRACGVHIPIDERLIFMGMTDWGHTLPGALSAFHIILWKFIIIHFTQVDTDRRRLRPAAVLQDAIRRFRVRIEGAAFPTRAAIRLAQSNRTRPPCTRKINSILTPFARVTEEGDLQWHRLFPATSPRLQ